MAIFYRWKSDSPVEKLILSIQNDLGNKWFEGKNNKIYVHFLSSRDFNRYYFKGKFVMQNDYTELRGVFRINRIINYIIFILSMGCMISIMDTFPPISLVNIACDLVYLLFFIVLNLFFYVITMACHNWSLFFHEDREEFLKTIDKYMEREK